MDEEHPKVGRKARRQWIKAPQQPNEATLERLRARFRAEPRIVEAWLVGSRMTPDDGSSPYETTDIALVLEPPLSNRALIMDLIADLDDTVSNIEECRGLLLVSETTIRAHGEQAVLLYSRA
jgi:hypothetical protein